MTEIISKIVTEELAAKVNKINLAYLAGYITDTERRDMLLLLGVTL